MSTEKEVVFDPYHKWLGISKAQRPVTYYQLLGISQGESDVEVIEEAAIRQTTHLRAYQVGPHADDCTKLLNEISTARQVLVNPQKRQVYETKLAQLAAKRAASQPGEKTAVVAAPIVESAFADRQAIVTTAPATGSRRDQASRATAAKPGQPARRSESRNEGILAADDSRGGGGRRSPGRQASSRIDRMYDAARPPVQPPPVANNNPPKCRRRSSSIRRKPPCPNAEAVDPKPSVDRSDARNHDPLAGVTGFPPLGAFTLQSAPRNLIALADGRVFSGDTNLQI